MAKKAKICVTFDVLKDVVSRTGILGEWVKGRKRKQTFRATEGGDINWWPGGRIEFKGDPVQRAILSVSFGFGKLLREQAMYYRANLSGKCCKANKLLPQILMVLAKSGQHIVLINNKICVLDEHELDNYRRLVAKGADINYREL